MSNKKPELVECRIKSFESRADESLWVTLDVPLTIARFMTKAASDGIPLRILVETVPAVPAQGASASNETTIKVTATPEWLAEQAVRAENHAITLIKPSVTWIAEIGHAAVNCPRGEELAAIRAWLAGLIREGYEAGVASVAQTKADGAACLVETYGPDALAKAREEGRRQGWEEAAAFFDATAKQHADSRDSRQREAHSLRAQAARLDEEARVQQETAKMARAVADELRAAAPKEPA